VEPGWLKTQEELCFNSSLEAGEELYPSPKAARKEKFSGLQSLF
jgi:hypothetical protein